LKAKKTAYPWILHEPSVEPSPGTPIDRILLVLNGLSDNLGIKVIM
jgi:hypothetical protein